MSNFATSVGPADLEKIHGLPKGSLTWCDKSLPADLIPESQAEFLEDMTHESSALNALVESLQYGVHEFGHLPTANELEEWQAQAAEDQWAQECAESVV